MGGSILSIDFGVVNFFLWRTLNEYVGQNTMDLNKGQNGIVVIGDVHGEYDEYLKIISEHEHTVQVGDFGFDYDVLKGVDPKKHRVVFV